MADITSQLNSVRNADSFTSLKEAIYETLDAISKAGIENDAIKDIQRTLTSLNKKIDEMDDSDDSLRTDITRLKDVIGSINKLVNSKADSKTLDQFKTDVDKKNSEFETAILQKADKNTVNQIEKDLSGKADSDAVSEELSKKADISTINTIEKELSEKMDAESIASVLSSKADISTVNTIEKELSDKVSTESFANALSGKADAEDINKLLSSPVMGIRVASAPGNVTTLKLNAPAYSGTKAITRGGDDTNFNDGEDGGSDLPENIGDGDMDQTGESSGDTGGTGSIDSTTELVALSYLNTVVGNLNQEINGKVDQHTFDEIVGDGFNTWTITDYIIRLREDWNTALNGMLTKQYADEVAHDAADTLSSIIMIDESPTEETKLLLETTDEDVELVEKDEFDAALNEYNQIFTFTWKGAFELGGIDEHGWKANVAGYARSVDLLGARDFACTLNSKYVMEVASYDHYKLYIDTTLPMSGEVTYNLYDHPGAEYIRLLIKNYDDSDIDDVGEVSDDVTLTMFGVDWTEENANKPVDITVVNKVKDRVNTLETKQLSNEGRLNTIEINQGAMDNDITDIYGRVAALGATMESKVAMLTYSEDGMIYFWADEEKTQLLGSVGPLVSGNGSWSGGGGGGGQGGGTNNAELTLRNTTGWITTTISDSETCVLSFEWTSVEDEQPTGEGSLVVYVNGARRITKGINQGAVSVPISNNYLNSGRNVIRLAVSDVYENVRYINYTVNRVSLYIRSSFDASTPYTGAFVFPYILTGDVDKTVYIEMDGEVIHTEVTSVSERQLTADIPAQTHGTHVLRAWYTAEVNGETISSNVLRYEVICIGSGSNAPIITSTFDTSTVEQYTNIGIKYRVYDPRNLTSTVVLAANGTTVNTISVDRTEKTWTYRADTPGELVLTITCDTTVKTFNITVTESQAQIEAIEEGLELFLTSKDRSNGENNPGTWSYESINATMTGFNYVNNGWVHDDDDNVVLRVNGGARVTIPLQIFARDFRSTGKTIEFEFATRYIRNYDTPIISCMSGNRGVEVTSQKAVLKSEQIEISTQFKEDEHVRISFVVEKRSENKLVYIYIDGIMSGVMQYPDGDDFSQINPVGITIGCNDSTVDIYNIRIYNTDLTRQQVLGNWIADTQNVDQMLARYDRNNVFDNYGNIVINKLPDTLPYMILNSEGTHLPQYKGDKVTISGQYIDRRNPSFSYSFEGAQFDVQGTSSQYYSRKNYKAKYKNGVLVNGASKSSYAMTADGMPAKVFCFKKDVASSEGANNVELVRLYDSAIRTVYQTPAQQEDPRVRTGIDGYPMVIFENNGTSTKFVGKYNHNFDKGAENVFGFVDGDESWEYKNNTSNRVLFIDADFTGSDWTDDFEARFPDEDPPYEDTAQLAEFISFVKSTNTEAATGASLGETVTYNGVNYTADTAAYRLAKFKAEIGNYVEINSMLFFYLFTELFLMVDNRAKNMFPSFVGSEVN